MIIYPNPHSNDYFGTENIDNLADSGRAEDDRRTAMLFVGYDHCRNGLIPSGRRIYEDNGMTGREEVISWVGDEEKDWLTKIEIPTDVLHGADSAYAPICSRLLYIDHHGPGIRRCTLKEGVAYFTALLNMRLV